VVRDKLQQVSAAMGAEQESLREQEKALETALASAKAAQTLGPVYWNSWFQNNDKLVRDETIRPGHIYRFVLDLSPYNYNEPLPGSSGSTTVSQRAFDIFERSSDELKLIIRPIVVGATIQGSHRFSPMQLNLTRLRKPLPVDEKHIEDVKAGRIDLSSFSQMVQAGAFAFDIRTGSEGCAVIALSIWDESGTVPLDHLVRRFPIGSLGRTANGCTTEGDSVSAMRGGFGTLLETAIDGLPAHATEAEAALHVFEVDDLQDPKSSIAIFVDAQIYNKAPSDAKPGEDGVYAWVMETPLSEYIENTLPPQLSTTTKVLTYDGIMEV
jgi:hypothetical protein